MHRWNSYIYGSIPSFTSMELCSAIDIKFKTLKSKLMFFNKMQAAELLVKVHAAIKSPKGQVISNSLSVGLDVLGILGIPAASSMSLAKDGAEFIIQWLCGKGVDSNKVMSIIHDLSAFIPLYSQYQSLLAFSIDSAQLANAIEQIRNSN